MTNSVIYIYKLIFTVNIYFSYKPREGKKKIKNICSHVRAVGPLERCESLVGRRAQRPFPAVTQFLHWQVRHHSLFTKSFQLLQTGGSTRRQDVLPRRPQASFRLSFAFASVSVRRGALYLWARGGLAAAAALENAEGPRQHGLSVSDCLWPSLVRCVCPVPV